MAKNVHKEEGAHAGSTMDRISITVDVLSRGCLRYAAPLPELLSQKECEQGVKKIEVAKDYIPERRGALLLAKMLLSLCRISPTDRHARRVVNFVEAGLGGDVV